jgi:hypothetical protein
MAASVALQLIHCAPVRRHTPPSQPNQGVPSAPNAIQCWSGWIWPPLLEISVQVAPPLKDSMTPAVA